MTRTKKTLSWLAGIVALVIVGIVIFVITFDWNRLKPTINQKVSTELNRPFAIRGNLGLIGRGLQMKPAGALGCLGLMFMLKILF